MQSITELNEEAAMLLETGHYDSALEILELALDELHSIHETDEEKELQHDAVARRQEKYISCSNNEKQQTPSRKRRSSNQILPQNKNVASTKTWNSNVVFICTSPMRFVAEEKEHLVCHQEEDVDGMSMGAILMFNMALSHHMKAIRMSSNASATCDRIARLKCALKMYHLCFRLLMEGDAQLTTEQVLALTNNCGQIYTELKLKRKAKAFFTHMLSTLMSMIEDGTAEDIAQLDGFIWNASRYILEDPAVAPAA